MKRKDYQGFIMLVLFASGILVSMSCARSLNKNIVRDEKTSPVLNVRETGAIGDGLTDDTRSFQKAIDSVAALGGGTVIVPKGNYVIDGDVSVKIKSHVTLQMVDSTAQLISKPTKSQRFYILMVINATDVRILGGKIMGDRETHLDTTGEWGMGIAVYAGKNVTIDGTKIYNCWGDGIVIGSKSAAPYFASDPSTNVIVKNVSCNNNRRQAITIGKANGVLIDSSILVNTNGTKPMAGIDIEPDRDTAQNIRIQNCQLAYNKGNGVEIYVNSKSVVRNVIVQNNLIHHNTYGGYVIRGRNVEFNYNRIFSNKYNPAIKTVDTVNCLMTPNTLE